MVTKPMATTLKLRCDCGSICGTATCDKLTPAHRSICYCDDCQTFAHFLDRVDCMDRWGGTAVYAVAPTQVRLAGDLEQLGCVRLMAGGLYRWYCLKCKTPIANTVGGWVPFVGLIHSFIDDADFRGMNHANQVTPKAYIMTRFALGELPKHHRESPKLWLILRTILLLLKWKLTGKGSPSPFFDTNTKAPRVKARVLSTEERRLLAPQANP